MDRLTAMEAFIRVVDAGSFSGAAKQLRTGQPAVSKAIVHLEERLGVRLLLRTTRRLTPTEAGVEFLRARETVHRGSGCSRTRRAWVSHDLIGSRARSGHRGFRAPARHTASFSFLGATSRARC